MNKKNSHKSKKKVMCSIAEVFTDDKDAGRSALMRSKIGIAQKIHWLYNMGDYNTARSLIKKGEEELEQGEKMAIRYRTANEKGRENSYKRTLSLNKDILDKIYSKGMKEGIILDGGLGDILEGMTRLHGRSLSTKSRQVILLKSEKIKIFNRLKNEESMVIKEWDGKSGVYYNIFLASIDKLPTPHNFINLKERYKGGKSLLCCWRAAGVGDKFSIWMRSVNFDLIYKGYQELKKQDTLEIIDMTQWKPWEKKIIENMGIKTIDPRLGDIYDIADSVNNASNIITVDTMLAHLCAAMNRKTEVLLPRNCDERWISLLKGQSCYQRNCNIIRQYQYGRWDECIDKVIKKI